MRNLWHPIRYWKARKAAYEAAQREAATAKEIFKSVLDGFAKWHQQN
jgi:hypothetical protein